MAAQRSVDTRSARPPSGVIGRAISGGGTTPPGSGGIGLGAIAAQIP
jgi:hypothetical protein